MTTHTPNARTVYFLQAQTRFGRVRLAISSICKQTIRPFTRGLRLSPVAVAVASCVLAAIFCIVPSSAQSLNEDCRDEPTILLIGGLNGNRDLLQPLEQRLKKLGFHTRQIMLSGHNTGESWEGATFKNWIADVRKAREETSRCVSQENLILLGYSTGATVALHEYAQEQLTQAPAAPRRFILLAPAIALTTRAALVRLFFPLRFLDLSLPSLSFGSLRAHSTVPVAVYRELFRAIDQLRQIPKSVFASTRVSVFIVNRDELVSAAKVKEWIAHRNLDWPVHEVETTLDQYCYNHLFVHPSACMGADWGNLSEMIVKSLASGD